MEIKKIDSAPKDGTWVLLFGGNTGEDESDLSRMGMADSVTRPVTAFWSTEEKFWTYAHWDMSWYSIYIDPTHWAALPDFTAALAPPSQI